MDEHIDNDSAPRSGCGKWIGGCLVVLVLLGIGAGYLWIKGPELMRMIAAKGVVIMVESVVEESLQLPEDERDAVMAPVEDLARRVTAGEVEEGVALAALGRAIESKEAAVVAIHAFESRYVDSELIPEAEREAAMLTANRFATGLQQGRIPRSELEPLADLVVEKGGGENAQDNLRLKSELSEADVRLALSHMAEAVAAAGIQDPYFERGPQELSALVDRAIEDALRAERVKAQGVPLPPGEDAMPGQQRPRPGIEGRPPRDEEDLGPAL